MLLPVLCSAAQLLFIPCLPIVPMLSSSCIHSACEQVEEKSSSLNSGDAFVLETPTATYVWFGKVQEGKVECLCYGISPMC